MAAEMGKDGFIAFGSSSGGATTAPTVASNYLDKWTLTPNVNLADVTAFGNSGRAFLPNIRDWKVTASGTLDMDFATTGAQFFITQMAQTTGVSLPVYVRLKTSTGAFTGPGVLNSVAINSKVDDKISVTYNITGTSYLLFN